MRLVYRPKWEEPPWNAHHQGGDLWLIDGDEHPEALSLTNAMATVPDRVVLGERAPWIAVVPAGRRDVKVTATGLVEDRATPVVVDVRGLDGP